MDGNDLVEDLTPQEAVDMDVDMSADVFIDEEEHGPAGTYKYEKELFLALRQKRVALEAATKAVKAAELKQMETLYEYMDDMDTKSDRTNDGTLLTRIDRFVATVKDKEAAAASLDSLGLLEAFTKTAWQQAKLNEYVKDQMMEGKDLPDGIDVLPIRQIRVTAPKNTN